MKDEKRRTVSVILPTYNRQTLLPRALESVVSQTFDDWEIVLVDDGSTDGTAEVAADYAKRLPDQLIYIQQANGGSSCARNTGIDACRGRFVTFLDSDDEFLPSKLARQLKLFDLRPELGLVYSDYAFVDLEGVRHESVFDAKCPLAREVPCERVAPGLCVCTGDLFDMLIRGYFIATIVGMVRREVLGELIRFPVDHAYAEEWLFYLAVVRTCRAGFVDEPLCLHHYTRGSLARTDSRQNTRRYRDALRAIRDSFNDLSRVQHRVVRRNLARTCRQLGYDTFHACQYLDAVGYFVESFWNEPRVRTLYDAVQAAARCLVSGKTPRSDEACRSEGMRVG